MLCLFRKGIIAWPICFFLKPLKYSLKMALVKFSLHTLKEMQQVFVLHCVSVHHCPELPKEQPAPPPTLHNPGRAPPKRQLCCGPASAGLLQGLFWIRTGLLKWFIPTCCRRALSGKGYQLLLDETKPKLCPKSVLNEVQLIIVFQSMGGYQK